MIPDEFLVVTNHTDRPFRARRERVNRDYFSWEGSTCTIEMARHLGYKWSTDGVVWSEFLPVLPVASAAPLHEIPEPNRFGAVRRFDVHTGVDFFCPEGTPVQSVEDGWVVRVCRFTGPQAGSPWWLPTWAVSVEGASGVFLYGEITPSVREGAFVRRGTILGHVARVLREFRGTPVAMLHFERYRHGYRGDGAVWKLGDRIPKDLVNPESVF